MNVVKRDFSPPCRKAIPVLDVEALQALLAPMGISQNATARALGVPQSALSRWLAGGNASYDHIAAVAERLGVPVAQLWRGPVPKKYGATSVPRGTSAVEDAFARGYAAAEFAGIAQAAEDIARRARVAAQRMGGMRAPSPPAAEVDGEGAESLALSAADPPAPRKRKGKHR